MKPIVLVPNDVLTTKAQPVRSFDRKLKNLINDMTETLLATTNPKGVGLAAPQIGVSLQVFLTKPSAKATIRVFINPHIDYENNQNSENNEDDDRLEGCLSIPNVWGKVTRHKKLHVRYQDEKGNTHDEDIGGFLAVIIQHETDHLNGTLFTHRVLEQKEKLFQVIKNEHGKEELEEIRLG